MELGFGPEGVEVQEPDDLARPLRHQEERVRGPLAPVDALGDRRGLVGLTDDGRHGGRVHKTRVLRRHRLAPDGGDGGRIGPGRIPDEHVLSSQHVRAHS